MERSPFLQGDDASPAKVDRERVRLGLLLALAASLAWLGSFGPTLNVATLRPAFATIGVLRTTLEGVAEERGALEEELAREQGRRALAEKSAQELREENRELLQQARFHREFPLETSTRPGASDPVWRMFRVMGITPSSHRHEFVIDAGTSDGIETGAVVTAFTPWGIALAGRVTECGWNASRVLAVTDPSSAVPVRVEGQGTGLLFQGGYPAPVGKLLYLRRDAVTKLDAEVRLVDISAAGGCLIGWVHQRHAGTSGDAPVSQRIDVLTAVAPAHLNFVWVESTAL